jgi:phospholipase/carboxylesterase
MNERNAYARGPHQDQPVLVSGKTLDQASAAMILVHGRGASAESILSLSAELVNPQFAFLAPQAAGNTWYPNRFLAPIASNEPFLSSALTAVSESLARLSQVGIPAERTVLLGFSQGACLTLEYAARHPRRYGGVVGLSGGLIGPSIELDDDNGTPRDYSGSLAGTPIFLGCSEADFHIPRERVAQSAEVLRYLGADVTMRLYPDLGHTVNQDELDAVRDIMGSVSRLAQV